MTPIRPKDIWFIADLHLGHTKIVTGFREDATGPRSHFGTIEQHDNDIIWRWNLVVKPQDKVYILGDVALSKRGVERVSELQGHKRLILGNHDQEDAKTYARLFEKVAGAKTLDGMLLTHVPVHPDQLVRRSMQVNLHGHLHDEVVTRVEHGQQRRGDSFEVTSPDPRYQCVSCEHVDYTPIHIDVVKANFGSYLT